MNPLFGFRTFLEYYFAVAVFLCVIPSEESERSCIDVVSFYYFRLDFGIVPTH